MKHVQNLIDQTQTKLAELQMASKKSTSNSSIKDLPSQLSACESRLHMLKKMKNNFETSDVPGPPKEISMQIVSSTSLLVSFEPPLDLSKTLVTKYKSKHFFLKVIEH